MCMRYEAGDDAGAMRDIRVWWGLLGYVALQIKMWLLFLISSSCIFVKLFYNASQKCFL